jgi:hypothetical protein
MTHEQLVRHAQRLADEFPDGLDGCEVGNSLIGSVMTLTLSVPRQYSEAACRDAWVRTQHSHDQWRAVNEVLE